MIQMLFKKLIQKLILSASFEHSNGLNVSVFARNVTDEVTATQLFRLTPSTWIAFCTMGSRKRSWSYQLEKLFKLTQ